MIRQPVPALLQPLCIEGGLPASIARRPAATIGWQSRRPGFDARYEDDACEVSQTGPN